MITNFERMYINLKEINHAGLAKKIIEILSTHPGKKNAIIGDVICQSIACDWNKPVDVRTLRKVIADMRLNGCPIGSCGTGYYLLDDEKETEKVIQSLVDRSCALQAVIRAMSSMYEELYGKEPNLLYD